MHQLAMTINIITRHVLASLIQRLKLDAYDSDNTWIIFGDNDYNNFVSFVKTIDYISIDSIDSNKTKKVYDVNRDKHVNKHEFHSKTLYMCPIMLYLIVLFEIDQILSRKTCNGHKQYHFILSNHFRSIVTVLKQK